MAAAVAARSIFRSTSVRNAASRIASQAKPSRSPFPTSSSRIPLSGRVFRSPVELSACVESLQPHHTATASALMTSMLTISRCGYAWLPEVPSSWLFCIYKGCLDSQLKSCRIKVTCETKTFKGFSDATELASEMFPCP
ncbi:hypothetical protein M9H77_21034 [Catharanthus roseus]|uniref:Uncharacterized protein n=1 Tax=Catharanthus roseus TaxID=4058 RepID=A0ACC0AQE7_CATRO|nr:hypothetical protein M9H77_21034 [Catharanthus roseus]